MRFVAFGSFVLFTAVTALGCAYGEMQQVLRTQVASEADCPEIQVTKKGLKYFDEDLKTDTYKVTGCGMLRTYTCPTEGGLVKYGSDPCTFVEGDPDRPALAAPLPPANDPFADSEPMEEEAPAEDSDSDSDSDEDSDEGI